MQELIDLYRHNTWANERVFAVAQDVDAGLLEAEAPGTRDTVRGTLALGFYVVPNDVQQHALRIAEEFSILDIAALAEQQHNTVVSIAGVITTLRIRQTKKGEQMAWLTLTDDTGAIETWSAAYYAIFFKLSCLRLVPVPLRSPLL